ncbi:unnamed protein product [Amoebophrya sp. A25]|nr:unnamed protein product [Amoebophrya sp. A25]|eukprot:GSA25T00022359001.1
MSLTLFGSCKKMRSSRMLGLAYGVISSSCLMKDHVVVGVQLRLMSAGGTTPSDLQVDETSAITSKCDISFGISGSHRLSLEIRGPRPLRFIVGQAQPGFQRDTEDDDDDDDQRDVAASSQLTESSTVGDLVALALEKFRNTGTEHTRSEQGAAATYDYFHNDVLGFHARLNVRAVMVGTNVFSQENLDMTLGDVVAKTAGGTMKPQSTQWLIVPEPEQPEAYTTKWDFWNLYSRSRLLQFVTKYPEWLSKCSTSRSSMRSNGMEALKHVDKELVLSVIEAVGYGLAFRNVPQELKDSEDFIQAAVARKGAEALLYVPSEKRRSCDFIRKMVQVNVEAFRYAMPNVQRGSTRCYPR